MSKRAHPKTLGEYKRAIHHYNAVVPDHLLNGFKGEYGDRLIASLRSRPLKNRTIQKHIVTLNMFFKWAYENHYCAQLFRIKPPRVEKWVVRTYSSGDLQQLDHYFEELVQSGQWQHRIH